QDRGSCGRSCQRPSGRTRTRQRTQQGAIRIPLGRSIQPQSRPHDGERFSRRNSSSGRRKARPLLQYVRTAVLLDENNGRSEAGHGSEKRGIFESRRGHLPQARIIRRLTYFGTEENLGVQFFFRPEIRLTPDNQNHFVSASKATLPPTIVI